MTLVGARDTRARVASEAGNLVGQQHWRALAWKDLNANRGVARPRFLLLNQVKEARPSLTRYNRIYIRAE